MAGKPAASGGKLPGGRLAAVLAPAAALALVPIAAADAKPGRADRASGARATSRGTIVYTRQVRLLCQVARWRHATPLKGARPSGRGVAHISLLRRGEPSALRKWAAERVRSVRYDMTGSSITPLRG